jgi:hypothetical protein
MLTFNTNRELLFLCRPQKYMNKFDVVNTGLLSLLIPLIESFPQLQSLESPLAFFNLKPERSPYPLEVR